MGSVRDKNQKFFLVLIVLLFLINGISTVNCQLNDEIIIFENRFQLEPDNFITYNFTTKKHCRYWLDFESNDSTQLFILNEGNFSLFKEKKTFFSLQIGKVDFFFDQPAHPGYIILGKYQIRVNNSERVIILINNPYNDTISGTIILNELFFTYSTTPTSGIQNNTKTEIITVIQNKTLIITEMKTIKVNVPLEPIGESDNKTNSFSFLTFSVVLFLITLVKRKKD